MSILHSFGTQKGNLVILCSRRGEYCSVTKINIILILLCTNTPKSKKSNTSNNNLYTIFILKKKRGDRMLIESLTVTIGVLVAELVKLIAKNIMNKNKK